jgi:hypothetical protein
LLHSRRRLDRSPIGPAGWDQVLGIFGPNYDSAIEHNAAELGEKAVTCCLDQPAVVSGDHRLEQFMSSFIA